MLRSDFQAEHGQYIPEDLCLCIENLPNRWTVSTWNDESLEALPEVEAELVEQVRTRCPAKGIFLRHEEGSLFIAPYPQAKQRTSGIGVGIGTSQSL